MIPRQRAVSHYLVALQHRFTAQELERISAEAERMAITLQARVITRLHEAAARQRLFPGR